MIRAVVWDFNGTVLNDVSASVGAVNGMAARRGLPPITEKWYTENLVIPLERFYAKVGFDMNTERIDRLSVEFQEGCAQFERPVFPEVLRTLEELKKRGLDQWLLSSLQHGFLTAQAAERGILPYFTEVCGREDHSLGGKEDAAAERMRKHGFSPREVLFVGDLTSDAAMAKTLGAPCVLIPKGHQCEKTLRATGAVILPDASYLPAWLDRRNLQED